MIPGSLVNRQALFAPFTVDGSDFSSLHHLPAVNQSLSLVP